MNGAVPTRVRPLDLALPVAAMILVVVASNILVQSPINDWLTWGAITYPVSFLVTDLTNRRFGTRNARRVVYAGFVLGVIMSAWFAGWRIALASGGAFLAAQLIDIFIFDRLRKGDWWRAPLLSSFLATTLDTFLFFSVAFVGTAVPWLTLATGDLGIKIAMAVILLAPYRALMSVVRPLPATA